MSGRARSVVSGVWRTIRFVGAEVRRSAQVTAVLCVSSAVALALTEGAGLLMLMPLLELVGVIEENPVPRAGGWLSQAMAIVGLSPTLGVALSLFVGVAAARSLVQRWQVRLQAEVREQLIVQLRVRLFRIVGDAEWRFLASRSPHDFAHALTSEVNGVGNAAIRIFELMTNVVIAAVYAAVALRVAPPLALLVLACVLLLSLIARDSLRRARSSVETASETRRLLHGSVAEHTSSIKSAKAAGAIASHSQLIADLSETLRRASLGVADFDTDLHHRLELGTAALLALIVFLSVTALNTSPAVLLLLLYVFARLMPRIVSTYQQVQALAASAPGVESLACLERDCLAAAEPADDEAGPLAPLREAVRLDCVSFGYLNRAPAVALDRLDLTIHAGLTTAVVGASGSGKTTLADIVTGLLSPTAGRLLVDGVVLTAARRAAWRGQVGYVAQDSFFFDDSVRRNLTLGRSVTEAELWRSLSLAAADRFVAELPYGLDTRIGDRGTQLSGGERQRLAIARALLRQPRLLVIDEATSALDPENAARVQAAIDRLQHRTTILIISHRLDMVQHADVIHVVEGGRVVQSGSWHDLRAQRHGRFAELLRTSDGAGARPA